jgi:ferritin-like metal-binding protein YciE
MGLFSKDIQSLDDLYVHTLRDIYYAEQKITKALPDMIDKTTDEELRSGFEEHLEQTRQHVARLEQVFSLHGIGAGGVDCPAIDGIIEEAEEISGDVEDPEVLDAALIAAAQAVEHYEITRYGSLIAWARQLGRDDEALVLEETLAEEKEADKKLTMVAESKVNLRSAA